MTTSTDSSVLRIPGSDEDDSPTASERIVADAIIAVAERIGFAPTESQVDQLIRHARLVEASNKPYSLTGYTDFSQIMSKLTVISLMLLAPAGGWLPTTEWWSGKRVIDVGTGAGFPGIPMAVMLPECQFTLLDARTKKCQFLHAAVDELKLNNVNIVDSRAESAGQDSELREQYDLATARNVAPMPVLAELVLPFVSVGGVALLQKGGNSQRLNDELELATGAIAKLGSTPPTVAKIEGADRFGMQDSKIVYLMKISSTPAQYPRNPGIPAKRPLR